MLLSQVSERDLGHPDLEAPEDVLASDAFMLGDCPENVIQRSDPHGFVRRYRYAMACWRVCI